MPALEPQPQPQHSGSGAGWQLGRKAAGTPPAARSPAPSRLAPIHLTERQQLALAMEESRRAAAAAAVCKGLAQPSDASTSGSDSESEGAYSSAHGAGLQSAAPSPQQRRRPQPQPSKRCRMEATSPAKSNQTDAMDSLDSTAAPSLARHTPPRSGECTPATASPLRTDDDAACPLAALASRAAEATGASDITAGSVSDGEQEHQQQRRLEPSRLLPPLHRSAGSGSSSQEVVLPAHPGSPQPLQGGPAGSAASPVLSQALDLDPDEDDAFSVRAQRLALRQAASARQQGAEPGPGGGQPLSAGGRQSSGGPRKRCMDAAPGSSAGSALKKQRQPQCRPSDDQPVSPMASAAAAAAAAAAAGLDPALVARLAAQRQQKYGCCPQKSARVPSLQTEKTAPTLQQQQLPQPQLAQKQRQAAQRDAPVSLQDADLFGEFAPTPRPKPLRVRIKAPERSSQQPVSPSAAAARLVVKQEAAATPKACCPTTLSAPAAGTAATAKRQQEAAPAELDLKAAAHVAEFIAADAASPPPTPIAITPTAPVPGVRTPEPSEAPAQEVIAVETPAAAPQPLPFGSPAVQPQQHQEQQQQPKASPMPAPPLASLPTSAASVESAEDAAFFAAARAAAASPAAAGEPAFPNGSATEQLAALEQPASPRSGSLQGGNCSGKRSRAPGFAKQRSLPVAKRRGGAASPPLQHALSCQVPARQDDDAAAMPPSPPVPGPKARRARGPSRSQSSRNAWATADLTGGLSSPRHRRLRSAASASGIGAGCDAFPPPMLALSIERQPPRRGRNRRGAVLAACRRLGSCDGAGAGGSNLTAPPIQNMQHAQRQQAHDSDDSLGGSGGLVAAVATARTAAQARHDAEGLRLQRAMDAGSPVAQVAGQNPGGKGGSQRGCICKWARGRGCGGGGCSAAAATGPAASLATGCGVLMAPLQRGSRVLADAQHNAAAVRAEQRQLGAASSWDDLSARHALETSTLSALAVWLA